MDFAAEAHNPPPPPHPLTHCIQYVYSIYVLIHTGKEGGGGESWTREKVRGGNSSQSWVKNTNMTDCISSLKNSDKRLPQSLLQVHFFIDDEILLWCLYS